MDKKTWILALAGLAVGCATRLPPQEDNLGIELASELRVTVHRTNDDLLSAGLGLEGLRGAPAAFADPARPSAAELRRRAIHTSWNGIADLGPLGGYGSVYGAAPAVPGREFTAFMRVPGASSPHRVLLQLPDAFDALARCVVVAASSGSRGVYGAIALAGAWGLPRGCAVAYTDKGAGSGYFDLDSQTGVALDGTRAARSEVPLEFEPALGAGRGVAVKHAHSGDNPEADWGRHVLQAAEFALAMLNRARPAEAPFTAANTRVIVSGVSNGAGAALQAAGLDQAGLIDGVVALAPNVHLEGHGRPLYDYSSEAALLLPCALADERFAGVPFARLDGALPPAWAARCARLHDNGLLAGEDLPAQAASALEKLRAGGWDEAALATAASSTLFDLWRAVAATYASAYLRRSAEAMPCGFHFAAVDAKGEPIAADAALRASWWADASGIPPGAGVMLFGGSEASLDPTAPGIECLRALWTSDEAPARTLRDGVAATAARLPRSGLPMIVAHGEADGLLPIRFSSTPYVEALVAAGRSAAFWRIPDGQHFDAFLSAPGFGERYVPLLPYAYAGLDAIWAHLTDAAEAPVSRRFVTTPRGRRALERVALGLERK